MHMLLSSVLLYMCSGCYCVLLKTCFSQALGMVLPVWAIESSFLQRACSLAQMLASASRRRASSPLAPCPSVQVARVCVSQWPNMQRRMRRCLRRCGRHGVFFYFCITTADTKLCVSPRRMDLLLPLVPRSVIIGATARRSCGREQKERKFGTLVHTCVPCYLCRELTSGPSC